MKTSNIYKVMFSNCKFVIHLYAGDVVINKLIKGTKLISYKLFQFQIYHCENLKFLILHLMFDFQY